MVKRIIMNHYIGKFVFHPVGHGLFYTGEITDDHGKSFSFAFDCGSEKKTIISNIIKNGKLLNGADDILPEQIDLFIISHFHSDHISNALDLINAKKIKTVILPYLTDTTKVLYASQIDQSLPNSSDLTQFIADPVSVINRLNENCEVHLLNEEEDTTFSQPEFSYSENDAFQFKWTDRSSSNPNQHAGNVSLLSPIWEFHFFMPKTGNNAKLQQLQTFFTSNSITIDNVANHYLAIEAEMKRLGLANNISNIVCAHGPSSKLLLGFIKNNIVPHPLPYPYPWIWPPFLNAFCPIQFLNGDAEIDDKSAFYNRYKDQLLRSILFQIPHHGSKNNWDNIFCNWQPFCELWPVTHNSSNRRKGSGIFPSANFPFISVRPVTDDPYSKLEFQILFFERR